MGAKRAITTEQCTVTVSDGPRHIQNSRDRKRVFDAAEDVLANELDARGITGAFRLIPIEGMKGSSAKQGVHVSTIDNYRIKLSIQPGSNDTAWKYFLEHVPKAPIQEVYDSLNGPIPAPAPRAQPIQDPVQTDAPQQEEVSLPPPACQVSTLLEDISLVAIAIRSIFESPHTIVEIGDLVEVLIEELPCEQVFAMQLARGLINRGHLKELENARVRLDGRRILEIFVQNGLFAVTSKAPVEKPTPENTVVRLPERRAPKRILAAVSSPRLGTDIDDLERRALTYKDACRKVHSLQLPHAELMERRAVLQRQIDTLDAELKNMDAERDKALQITLDQTYSSAAERFDQIRSILDA